MNIQLVNKGTEAEVLLEGHLDSAVAADAGKALMDIASRFESLTLNLENLEYTASAGLRIFRNLYIAMDKKGGNFYIKNVKPTVMEVFEMTGFASFLKFI